MSKLRSISYSSLSDKQVCGWYFYLKNVKRLNVFTAGIWTHYGTLVHKYVQAVLMDEMGAEDAAKKFIRTWFRFCDLYKKPLQKQYKAGEFKLPPGVKNPKELYKGSVRAIMGVKQLLYDKFGEHKVLAIEYKLKEPTDYEQYFGGYIDILLQKADGAIVIVDFKTCSSHYMFNKYRDKFKDYQLTLYKRFYSAKYDLNPKTVETYFLTVAKDPKVKKSLQLTEVTSGPRKVNNAMKWLNDTLDLVKRNVYVKNKMACRSCFYGKTCPFLGTEHCK